MSDEKFIFRLGGNLHNVKPTITKDHALPLKESKTGFLDNTAGKRQTTDEGNSIQEVRILCRLKPLEKRQQQDYQQLLYSCRRIFFTLLFVTSLLVLGSVGTSGLEIHDVALCNVCRNI